MVDLSPIKCAGELPLLIVAYEYERVTSHSDNDLPLDTLHDWNRARPFFCYLLFAIFQLYFQAS